MLLNAPVSIHRVSSLMLKEPNVTFDLLGKEIIIRIQELNEFAAGPFEPPIPCRRDAATGTREYPHPISIRPGNRQAVVLGPVIHHNDLNGAICLVETTLDCLLEPCSGVVARNDNAYGVHRNFCFDIDRGLSAWPL